MKTDIKNDTPRIVYTGERFKKYLQRNKISYKEAAELLGIDKNTVGKAVRGGNLNLDIILRICNVYPLRIADFFITAGEEGEIPDSDYYISLEGDSQREGMVSEEEFCYKKCQNLSDRIKEIADMIETSHNQLVDLSQQYLDCCQLLDSLVTRHNHTHPERHTHCHEASSQSPEEKEKR